MKDDQKEVLIQNTSTGFALLQSIQNRGSILYLSHGYTLFFLWDKISRTWEWPFYLECSQPELRPSSWGDIYSQQELFCLISEDYISTCFLYQQVRLLTIWLSIYFKSYMRYSCDPLGQHKTFKNYVSLP